MFNFPPITLGALVLLATQFFLCLRWMYRSYRNAEINRRFVKDVATNHLPHLYQAMKQIARASGIELEDPPPVQWIDFDNGNGHHKKFSSLWHRMT
jgi:hypothetical protein